MTHVDIWSVAQVVPRQGLGAEFTLLEMASRDKARGVWPVSLLRHPVPNVASSNAVQEVLHQYPWADSGLSWKGTVVYKEQPGEDRTTLFETATRPGPPPANGPSNSGKDAETSSAPPPKAMPSASTKAGRPEGKATSPGRPASETAATDKGEKEPALSKASTTVPKAASDSGVGATSSTPKADTTQSRTASDTATSIASAPRRLQKQDPG